MKVFLDTNVLVSAVTTRGLCADVVRKVLLSHKLVVSTILFEETRSVLAKKIGIPPHLVEQFISFLSHDAEFSSPDPVHPIEIRDDNDILMLSSASNGAAKVFVTGDKELLELGSIEDMAIVSPREFWEKSRQPD